MAVHRCSMIGSFRRPFGQFSRAASKGGRRLWLLALILPVAACSPSSEQDMIACHSQAIQTYPQASGPFSPLLDSYEKACMAARGFRFSAARADCGRGDLYENAACYSAERAI
jgi:hypothetical protein